ncbi:chromosomal replication initiator protein DnaA [Marinilongibacter aquaticus]|uniref:chromosomal replication initiator protein DnaA n=1 Tax=Marinilongibacter aquaticus TaxID=2975157 RepID=UPI0021BD13E3|nr:chromosomal replication initiator protein DnaA [Marinilongibacter aquaticus]UBM61003.1 chromosomal replication initiator protein DnaA [Marinilongibacter aquaticus]
MENNAGNVWNNCLKVIRQHISEQSYKTWFEPVIPYKLQGKKLVIQVPSQFFYEWLEDNYVQLLRKALDFALGKDGQLEYSIVVDSGDRYKNTPAMSVGAPKKEANPVAKVEKTDKVKSPFILKGVDSAQAESFLNRSYTFNNFIEGDCNRLARAASHAVAEKPSVTSFNPLMIYGGVGLGKTHLVQAIGNHIKSHFGNKIVLYVSSEKFTSQFINSIRDNSLQDFMAFYMQVDVLILDDVQFLSGKEKTQETFFHIFNHLHQSGKQIVMTSDRPPRDLEGMEDRLLSRFKWGLTADLQCPDLETRIAIIQKKVQDEGIEIDYEVIEYLAHSIDSNVRELEGVIISLIAQASLTQRVIDLELAKRTLNHIVTESEKEVNIDTIVSVVTEHYGVRIADLKSKSRLRSIVIPRQIAMYLTKELTNLSLKSIGYHFGGRDHSTVIHAIQTVNDLMDTDKDMHETVNKLMQQFKR